MAGTVTAGEPNAANGNIRRYLGRCGARAAAVGNFLREGTPLGETRYIFQFYAYTGLSGGGSAKIFSGLQGNPGTEVLSVAYDNTAGEFDFTAFGLSSSITGIVANRWYRVQCDWNRVANPNPQMTCSAKGNGETTARTMPTITAGAASSHAVDYAEFGWISNVAGNPTASSIDGTTPGITVDAFESRRATAIPSVCRGDANLDGSRNSGDATQISLEFLSSGNTLPAGSPDATEDGRVRSDDSTRISLIFLAGQGPCASGT